MKLAIALIAALLLAPLVSLHAAPPEAGSPADAQASGDSEIGSAAPNADRKKQKSAAYLETGGERKLDVTYKRVGPRDLQLDLYYPTVNRAGKSPGVIYTHGGGWAAGSRQGAAKYLFASLFTQLLAKGFCVVPVDYRLWNKGGTVAMRDCVIDSKDAVRYLAKHSKSLGLDSERFFVMGDSAGGQIAMMLLLTPPDSLPGDPQLADATYRILAGASWYGPGDFENQTLFNHDDRADFADRFGPRIAIAAVSPEERIALYREMSPIRYLAKDSPRLLMIQGDKDTTIPVKHAYYMKEKAAAVHAPVEIMIVKNAGHNWREVGAPIEPTVDEIVQRTVRFFSEQLSPTRPPSHSGK